MPRAVRCSARTQGVVQLLELTACRPGKNLENFALVAVLRRDVCNAKMWVHMCVCSVEWVRFRSRARACERVCGVEWVEEAKLLCRWQDAFYAVPSSMDGRKGSKCVKRGLNVFAGCVCVCVHATHHGVDMQVSLENSVHADAVNADELRISARMRVDIALT